MTSGALIDFDPKEAYATAARNTIDRKENRSIPSDAKEGNAIMYQYSITKDSVGR
jgi:hypothetical protein